MALFADCACFQTFSQIIFSCILLKILWGCWNFIYVYCLGKYPDFHKYGKWSIVTGGTDGIGLAYVRKLAALGQNVVVIGRNDEKVRRVATEVSEKYQVKTEQIVVDFADSNIYSKIAAELEGLDVGTLINNVGVGFENLNKFLDFAHTPEVVEKMITVNAESLVKMTRLVLPGMLEKKKGIIVNIGSSIGIAPTPFQSLYSASKRFVHCFTMCMHSEYADKGIITQCIMPSLVTTKMSKFTRSNFFILTPDKFVSSALKTIGRCPRSFGAFSHALQGKFFETLPESWATLFFYRVFSKAKATKLKQSATKQQ